MTKKTHKRKRQDETVTQSKKPKLQSSQLHEAVLSALIPLQHFHSDIKECVRLLQTYPQAIPGDDYFGVHGFLRSILYLSPEKISESTEGVQLGLLLKECDKHIEIVQTPELSFKI